MNSRIYLFFLLTIFSSLLPIEVDKSGIKRVGGGKDKKEAIQGIVVEEDGIKIGLLSFSRVIPNVKWYATDKRSGIVGAYNK